MSSINSPVNDPKDGQLDALSASPELDKDIVSVNSNVGGSNNKTGKAIFLIVCTAIAISAMVYLSKSYLDGAKASARAGKAKNTGDEVDPLNPEATKSPGIAKVGAASGRPPPRVEEPVVARTPGPVEPSGVRPIKGNDGKVMLDPQGRALGIDPAGQIVPVPAIAVVGGEVPRGATGPVSPTGSVAQQPAAPKPSRYGGSLFVDKSSMGGGLTGNSGSGTGNTAGVGSSGSVDKSRQTAQEAQMELYRGLMAQQQAQQGGATRPTPSPVATPFVGQPVPPSGGGGSGSGGNSQTDTSMASGGAPTSTGGAAATVARDMVRTATPVAVASMFTDQDLMLPKGRQADCVLTTRVDDQLPGFLSCTLLNDMYSDNGKTLLLERGSDIWGEYGTINQAGLSRIAANWVRIKTPDGVVVDMSSPGSDPLGGAGMPGHYNPRWGERIGAAVLISIMKDVTTAIINNQSNKSGGGTSVVVSPGQNTIQGTGNIADQVIRETLRVRPNVTIAEGTRISIYVARDLDFRKVYELRHAAKLAKANRQ
jgi:type IV secretion system protein VirB10